jgi:chemosensory pili system protein ChpA (sensor histidine kinase/response regulator)
MQNLDTATVASGLDVPENDLGPLAWVLDELRKSLDTATKALRRYVRDAELARGSDLATVDSGQLRISRQQLHQAVGALEMVGFTGPATVLRSMESAVQKFVTRPDLCTEAAAIKIERASFALTGYLETLLAGKTQSPVALFVQYAEVQEIAGATRVHPADLWPYAWRWTNVADTGVAPAAINPDTRTQFDKAALMVIKAFDAPSAGDLARLSAAIAAPAGQAVDRQFTIFWRIAAGFFEAIATNSLIGDVYVKRTVSRILIQLASHTKGDMTVSDRLAQDLLFFCAQAQPKGMAPLLGEVRMAYGLAAHPPVSYTTSSYGQFDPALLVQARKRITTAKESWSGLSAGDMGKLRAVQDQFSLIVDSITKLLPSGQTLSAALMAVAESVAKSGKAPEPALGMEVATSVLYLEAGFEDFDPNDPALAERVNHLASRVENARQGATNQPLEPWMEELYRRVSDRQTMGSVVGELKTSLADLEKSLDQFFRDPQDKTVLDNVPSRLAQMRGVLSVLGLDQAAHTVMRMRDSVEQIMVTEVDDVRARAAGTFDKLGNNLGSLGFLIDMLSYQPVLAKKLFVFDEKSGELKPLMGRISTPIPLTERTAQEQVVADAHDGSKSSALLAAAAVTATAASLTVPASQPVALVPATVEDTTDDDAELLDIFLEEAREVIANGQEAVTALESDPSNLADLTTLRRAFHTLKGSSRMVGLNTFGDAGWSLEQMLNAWLADQKPADDKLRSTASEGLRGMARWVEDIAAGKAQSWSAAPFHASADSLRLHGLFLPLQLGDVADSESPHDVLNLPEVPTMASLAGDALAATPAPLVAAVSQPADLDFAFDLSLPEPEAAALPAHKPADALPEALQAPFSLDLSEPSTITVDDGLSFVDLGAPVDQPTSDSVDITEEELADEFADVFGDAPVPDLPAVAAPDVLASDEFEFEMGDEAALPADELVSADEFAAFERAMQEQDAWLAAHSQPSEPVPAIEKTELTDISERAEQAAAAPPDFSAFATQPMVFQPEPVAQPVHDFDFDLGGAVASSSSGSSTASAAGLAGLGLAGVGALAATTVAAAPVATAPTAPPNLPTPPITPPVQPSSYSTSAATFTSDEQYKAIGPLRISLQLYNVYLNEADEWSRRLVTCLTEWSLEPTQPLPADSVIFAHSLAGSSSTVGFTALAGLSRTMESALQHVQNLHEDAGYSAHVYAADFVNAAEEIRRLLHQFAAGLLREPIAAVEEALARCLRAPELATEYHSITASSADSSFVNLEENTPLAQKNIAQPAINFAANDALEHMSAQAPSDHAHPTEIVQSGFSTLETTSSVTVIAAATAAVATTLTATPVVPNLVAPQVKTEEVKAAEVKTEEVTAVEVKTAEVAAPVEPHAASLTLEEPLEEPAAQTVFTPLGLTTPDVPATPVLSAVARSLSEQESEDEIDVLDALDPDLFPIFEEEALELFPQMSSALRQWTSRPSNTGARSEVLRGLHTLKGSARLAGAMRLGELAHRMETAIEHTPEDEASTAKIEPLTGLLDGMQANFDRLRHPQEAAPAAPAAPMAKPSVAESASSGSMATKVPAAVAAAAALTTLAPLRASSAASASTVLAVPAVRTNSNQTVRVRSQLLDRLVNQAGEVMITRSRLEAELGQLRGSLGDLTGNLDKLRHQLRDIEVQSESQMQSRMALAKESNADFDPLEFDRFTRVQELTRMMAESVNDVATVQRSIQRTVEATEDDLVAQARQTRELQRDLLRTRMVEFEGISERLYRVVRQASKDAGKLVKLDIVGGSIEMDRGVLDRMTPAFEHLLRNCVAHGIETTEARVKAGKDASGQITISLHQEGNDISVEFRDDGAGLNLARIRERATAQGLLSNDKQVDDSEAANLIFTPGFTTATQITELSGRGIGMDVVRSEVVALGGRIETSTAAGQGTNFKLVMPLTTAVTQVVMLRIGNLSVGVPANLVEVVRRATPKELQAAYNTGTFDVAGEALPFFWSGALLQHSRASDAAPGKTIPVLVFRSAAQRIVAHVDEVLGNQEVVVKNLGPQLSRLPGLAGMSVLASGAVALIYNPVALAAVYGTQARAMSADKAEPHVLANAVTDVVARDLSGDATPVVPLVPANPASISAPHIPLVLVVDDSITVRRVTQRLLQREGYRVALAADGLLALERLAEELPSVVLTDIEMPRMDGFDLVRNLKADPRLAGLPIITITSRIAEKHREHAMALGVNHYLGKPYSEEELLSLIRRYTAVEMPV